MAYFHNDLPIFYYYGASPYTTATREFKTSTYNYTDIDVTNWYYAKAVSDTYTSSAISNLFNNASWGTQATTYYKYNGTALPFTTRASSGLPIMNTSGQARFSILYATATQDMSGGNVTVLYVPASLSCKVTFNTSSYTIKGDGVWLFLQAAGGGGGGGDNEYWGQGQPGGGGGASGGAAWVWLNAKKLYSKSTGAYFSIESTGWINGGSAGSSGSGFTSGSQGASIFVYAQQQSGYVNQLLVVPGGGGGVGMTWKGENGQGGSAGDFNMSMGSGYFGSDCLWATCLKGKAGGKGNRGASGASGESYSGYHSLAPIWLSTFALTTSAGFGTAPSVTNYGGGGGASIAGYKYSLYGYGGRGAQSATTYATAGGCAYCAVLSNTYAQFSAPAIGFSTTTSHVITNNNDVDCILYYSTNAGNTWNTVSVSAFGSYTVSYTSGQFKGLFYITPSSNRPGRCSDLSTG